MKSKKSFVFKIIYHILSLLNYILLILPQSRFSPRFSQPPHIVNILDDSL